MTPPETKPVVTAEDRDAAIDREIAEELANYTACIDPGACIVDRRVVDEAIHALKRRESSTRELREEVERLQSKMADQIVAADVAFSEDAARIATLEAQLATAATRFEHCADMIATSFNISGTLRAERTVKAKHYALEARETLASLEVKP